MDFNVNKIRLPAPVNIHISYPKLQGHLVITWNNVNNPDKNNINGNIVKVMYNVYRGISTNGIFYKLNDIPLESNLYQDRNIGNNPNTTYWYKISTVYLSVTGEVVEGLLSNPNCYRVTTMNKWFNKINERNMWILKNTGMLFDFYTRKYEGVKCTQCHDSARGRAGQNSCTVCFGTGYEGGYEPMSQLYIRLKPAEESLKISTEQFTYDSIPGAWTISTMQIKNRDLLIDPEGQMYQVTSSYVNQAAGYLFHQDLKLRALEPNDKLYKIKRAYLKPDI